MFTFRQKIIISYLLVLILFMGFMVPYARATVNDIVQKAMEDRTTELITRIQNAPNNDALIHLLKEQKPLIFFRVSVISHEKKILYDSHTKRLLGPLFSQEYVVSHPEVAQAFKEGKGYSEEHSEILKQDFAYFAKAFEFHGKTYVLRTAFPLEYVAQLTKDFEFGFLISAFAILLMFSIMTWFILHYLTRPIQQIITAIKPYQEGITTTVPDILIQRKNRFDEFGQLANTLNSLSVKIKRQINSLTQERNEKEVLLESLVEGVIAVDENMKIIFLNHMAKKLLELSGEKTLEESTENLLSTTCYRLLKRCQEEQKILVETIEVKQNGKKIFLDLVAAPKKDKKGAILVIQDKTEHYKIIEMRKEFVANASHELKTPITIIRGFAEALHDNPTLPRETTEEITEKIVRNCQKMNILIKDLLTLTDIEHIPDSRLVECNITELAEDAKHTVQEAYPDAIISVEAGKGEDYFLSLDPNLIELALVNLIENGVKYSPSPAEVTVSIEKEKGWVKISIKDKGMGIPKKELENIFQRFYRVDQSRAKKIGGSGLGLSIVETIIAKHSGKISVDSEEGKGSTFIIYLSNKS